MVETVIRGMLLILVVLLAVAAAGYGICRGLGVNFQFRAMLLAGGLCLVADEIALIPLVLARNGNQLAVSQAGLIGTVIQLFISIGAAGAVTLAHFDAGNAFIYWLFAFYFAGLMALVAVFLTALRRAPIATQTPRL